MKAYNNTAFNAQILLLKKPNLYPSFLHEFQFTRTSKQAACTDTNLPAKNLITEKNITYALKKPENKILKPQNKTKSFT